MSKARAREAAARANLEAQGIMEGTDSYHELMQGMRAGRVPKRETGGAWGYNEHEIEVGRNNKAQMQADGTDGAIRDAVETARTVGFPTPGHRLLNDPPGRRPDAEIGVTGRPKPLSRLPDYAGANADTGAGMMKLGGPNPDDIGFDPRQPTGADLDDGEIAERTIATDAVDTYADSDMLGPGLHPRVKGQLDKAMDVMQRSQMARGVRESHVVFPGEPPIYEGGFSQSHDLRGFADASHAFGSGQPRAAAPQPETGEGSWKGVHEGGRGFANPAVQRAAQAARKGK